MVAGRPDKRSMEETMESPLESGDSMSDSASDDPASSDSSSISWAPDGGWGWMVVIAVFFVNFLIDGCAGSFGILYPELLEHFQASPATTSMAGSLIVAVYLFSSKYLSSAISVVFLWDIFSSDILWQ